MSELYQSLNPELVWGLFTRGLGLVFFVSYASLARQVVNTAGRDGGFPGWRRLAKLRQDFSVGRRWLHFPTLLWLNDSDMMLRALTWVGLAASGLVIYGGPFTRAALAACYVCYVSLDLVVGLIYPWDCALFEASVFSLFLPPTHSLPALGAVAAPAPALAWAFRLLLFRLMFGFGKQKFMGSTNKDLSYLKGFLIGQPLPSPLAWYAQKLPMFMLQGMMFFMFFAEVPAPFFALVPGVLSIVCAITTVFLMIGIQATGNFGYFSLLTIVGCIPLLDNVTPAQLTLAGLFGPGAPLFVNAFVLLHTFCACLAFPFNSWVGQCWHMWAFWYRLPRLAQLPLDIVRVMHPFRWLHPYGVFPPNTGPGIKITMLVELSWDMQSWHELEFNYALSNPKSRPQFIAPYHPRGDQAVIYETFGLSPTSLVATTMGPWDPSTFGQRPAAHVLLQRILEGHAGDFVKGAVVEKYDEPPRAARISLVMLEPTSLAHHRATGEYWKRTYVGPHIPPRTNDPDLWEDFLPEAELWHFDAITWRRRSRLKHLIDRSQVGREDPLQLVLAHGDVLSAADVERFWNDFLPYVGANNQNLDTLPDLVPQVRARYDRVQLRALNRLFARFALLLVARLEPLYLGRGFRPLIQAETYLHLWLLAHHVIGKGKDAYLKAMADPIALGSELAAVTTHTGLYYFSLFRYEAMVMEAQKLRLLALLSPPYDEDQKRAWLAAGVAGMNKFQQRADAILRALSGFYCVSPGLLEHFKGPRFDLGYPELYPSFRQLESGEIVVRAYAEPPAGVQLPATPSSVAAE
jgi:hypothetical protein